MVGGSGGLTVGSGVGSEVSSPRAESWAAQVSFPRKRVTGVEGQNREEEAERKGRE